MKIFTDKLGDIDPYKLITGSVVPRPIAWVTTINETGVINLAPFSNFATMGAKSLRVGFGVLKNDDSTTKDTERNIRLNNQCVIHIGSVEHLEQLHQSSFSYNADVSEIELMGIQTVPSDAIIVPRIPDIGVSMECKIIDEVRFDEDPDYSFFVAKVLVFHIDDELYSNNGRIDTQKLNPLMRIGGPNYASIGEIFERKYLTAGYKE